MNGRDWRTNRGAPGREARQETAGMSRLPDWRGTGRCAEAQADGVPCTALGKACDTCERAWRPPIAIRR